MPKLSRFLYSNWIKALVGVSNNDSLSAHDKNKEGYQHKRPITVNNSQIEIGDEIKGLTKQAVIRWHLPQKTGN